MVDKNDARRADTRDGSSWINVVLLVLVVEKIVQHVAVTAAFYCDLHGIRSTVAVSPDLLMVLGAIIAALFALSLWGLVTRQNWALRSVIALALFDIVGEFVAQGRLGILITVSFLVATTLLILALACRRQEPSRAM